MLGYFFPCLLHVNSQPLHFPRNNPCFSMAVSAGTGKRENVAISVASFSAQFLNSGWPRWFILRTVLCWPSSNQMWVTENLCRLTTFFFFFLKWNMCSGNNSNYFRQALRKLNRTMVKVKTCVLVLCDDLTTCSALSRDFCPKHVPLQFFQSGEPFSPYNLLIWELFLFGKFCFDSVPASRVAQRGTIAYSSWNKPSLAWHEGLENGL